MKFSIIVPSYNQPDYIEETLKNIIDIKELAEKHLCTIEVLLFDSESNIQVINIIEKYKPYFDFVEIKKDKGQFDAINKGIQKCTGDYWTWLNTDDTLNIEGFYKMVAILKEKPSTDYIYGSINYINEKSEFIKTCHAFQVDKHIMISKEPSIFQQGSFFKTSFTKKIGLLKEYNCCFDYEYVLRCLFNNAIVYKCDFIVANFRQHAVSKTGSIVPVFIREQLIISKEYGRKFFHFMTWFANLRLIKHKVFPR
ncbi:MAG: glycosyltransferase [Bacteroidota bacterium]|nr:glycosyltransferase [Bacteroidota bacterium]